LLTDEEHRRVQVKADRDELAVTESRYTEGESGPGAHFHREHSDCFYVLEGRLVFELDGERMEATAGGFVAVPPLVVHSSATRAPGTRASSTFTLPAKTSSSIGARRRPRPLRHLRPVPATGGKLR
jgi:quercetin dioxygenase-like cupin family protein